MALSRIDARGIDLSNRSRWLCADPTCRHTLATVRGDHPRRRLSTTGAKRTVHREDGQIEMTCGKCGKVSLFSWRVPK